MPQQVKVVNEDAMLVFIIEREEKAASFLSSTLEEAGFMVRIFHETATVLQADLNQEPALIILDEVASLRGLGTQSGLKSTRKIVLSARTSEGEKVQALESGADDYITKPLSARELVARVRAVLRSRQPVLPANRVLTVGSLSVDLDARRAWTSEREIFLTATEFNLLLYFMRHPDQVLARKQLEARLWPEENGGRRIVDVYIRRLRQKIELEPSNPLKLITCRGVGYMLFGSNSLEGRTPAAKSKGAS
jgi:DNA-binding response OmpR family regulator